MIKKKKFTNNSSQSHYEKMTQNMHDDQQSLDSQSASLYSTLNKKIISNFYSINSLHLLTIWMISFNDSIDAYTRVTSTLEDTCSSTKKNY